MSKIQSIDDNFNFGEITRKDIKWLSLENENLVLYGTPDRRKILTRIDETKIKRFSEGIQLLGTMTSGVRVRFKTNSQYIVVKAILETSDTMPHMADTGISGFDLYYRDYGDHDYKYHKTFQPQLYDVNHRAVVVGETSFSGERREKDIIINFPLYNGVKDIVFAVEDCALIKPPTPYTIEKPILFYGSSITQGGCASRPGNSYPLHLSRWLDADIINLGFSGNAKGDIAMAEHICEKDMSVLVMDYDHNSPTIEDLKKTYQPFYKCIRNKHQNLPIVMISRPNFDENPDDSAQRRTVIYNTYVVARQRGDNHVYFIDGESLFGEKDRDSCTVDGCHPNDIGFIRMAEHIYPVLKQILTGLYSL
ncbi:MAG: SGNH/GDSL hydrolase family protein [Cellulosilyticaceae bacterium]